MNKKIISVFTLFLVIFLTSVFVKDSFSQAEREDNPRTWKYFRLQARAQDDSIFIKLQDDLLIEPKLESYNVTVDVRDPQPINQIVIIGDEASPEAQRYAWDQLSKDVQDGLINWVGSNKENLNKSKLNYGSVFTDVFSKIRVKEVVSPPSKQREISSTRAYINPYFQIFGGEALGIPLKGSFGFSFSMGTPYSGPLESEMVSGYFHLLGASIGVNTRIKELTRRRASRDTATETGGSSFAFADYNNVFTPNLGLEATYVIPFGNFFQVGLYTVLDSGKYDPPIQVINTALTTNGDTVFMPNNNLKGSYFNWEFRYPFRTFGSTRAKVYVARYLGETNIGFIGREMRLAGSIFDTRINATLAGVRNFQLLIETMISGVGEGFSLTGFAFGPSIRLGKKSDGKFGALTILLNARLKVGDFFDETAR